MLEEIQVLFQYLNMYLFIDDSQGIAIYFFSWLCIPSGRYPEAYAEPCQTSMVELFCLLFGYAMASFGLASR